MYQDFILQDHYVGQQVWSQCHVQQLGLPSQHLEMEDQEGEVLLDQEEEQLVDYMEWLVCGEGASTPTPFSLPPSW